MRWGRIPTYIGIGMVFSMVVYAWTVMGSSPQAGSLQTTPLPTPTDTPVPWWKFATPLIATNTPVPTATPEDATESPGIPSTENCPAMQTPTPPVINIVLPPVVISTPVSTVAALLPTIVPTATVTAEHQISATVVPTIRPPQPTPTIPTITRIFGPVVAHGTVNTNVLRLRYGPSADRKTVVFLFDGTRLDVYGKSPDGQWLGVRVTGTKLYGWVYAKYVKIEP